MTRCVVALDAQLEATLDEPGGYGGLDAMEPIALSLLFVRARILRVDPDAVSGRYRQWLAREFGAGNGSITSRASSLQQVVEKLRDFCSVERALQDAYHAGTS